MAKWELDLWYELWDRAGSQGLDTWYGPRGVAEPEPPPGKLEGVEAADGEGICEA